MSSPSSPIDVATIRFISPVLNFSINSCCSFWLNPIPDFFAWPTKTFSLIPSIVFADVGSDINEQLEPVRDVYGQSSDVDQDSFVETIAKVIKIVLSFLGIIFLVLIIYAGFLWLTSAGSEERIGKAKSILISSIIGVAIILTAYMITSFVIGNILSATGAN